jgi:hypothetical protein
MSVPFFDLKEPRASLMQVPSGLVSQYAFDQKPPLLQIELPTLEMYCLMGYELVRGTITGLGLDTLTWRLAPEESSRFPLFANRGLWASYGEVAVGRDLPLVKLNASGLNRLAHAFHRHPRLAVEELEAEASQLRLRSAFADGAFYSAWALRPAGVTPFSDLFAHEIEYVDGPPLDNVFSFADLFSEISIAKRRRDALADAIFRNASAEIIASERAALLETRYGKELHESLLNALH